MGIDKEKTTTQPKYKHNITYSIINKSNNLPTAHEIYALTVIAPLSLFHYQIIFPQLPHAPNVDVELKERLLAAPAVNPVEFEIRQYRQFVSSNPLHQ